MLMIGICICPLKLSRPMGTDKQGYRDVSLWINENLAEDAVIVASDKRISFYAQRKGKKLKDGRIPSSGEYVVKIIEADNEEPASNGTMQKVYWQWVDKKKKKKKVVVYDVKD